MAVLDQLEHEMRACRLCAPLLSPYGVEPRPIFRGGAGFPVFLLGQAPGRTEYEVGAPFQGAAGQSIRALFADCGLTRFDEVVYQAGVTKCFPGRRAGSSTDRMPSPAEVRNCLPFLVRQLELLKPKLLVCLGGLSWKAFITIAERDQPDFLGKEIGVEKMSDVTVARMVGRAFSWRGSTVIPMIHPAGSANGARAAHPELDRRSKELLKEAIGKLCLRDI